MTADRVIRVSPERLPGWLERFTARHGGSAVVAGPETVVLTAADGAVAAITVPFPPLLDGSDPIDALLAHVRRDRLVGALLVRRGGHAVGVFAGPVLRASKVGRSYVQGRTKAGGWSQQRFARRREGQADRAYAAAAESAYAVLGPVAAELAALVGGGDRRGVEAVLDDPRLASLRSRLTGRVLPTPDPRLDVLRRFGDTLREVEIRVVDPVAVPGPPGGGEDVSGEADR